MVQGLGFRVWGSSYDIPKAIFSIYLRGTLTMPEQSGVGGRLLGKLGEFACHKREPGSPYPAPRRPQYQKTCKNP